MIDVGGSQSVMGADTPGWWVFVCFKGSRLVGSKPVTLTMTLY